MSGLRPVHLFIGLIALAAAGCADSTALQQRAPGAVSSTQPKLLIVKDFAFSPDVIVVDPEFRERLQRKLGTDVDSEIVKAIAVKRVSDEIAATILLITRSAGLHTEPDDDALGAPSNGTLILTGQLHANDKNNRTPRAIGFGAGAVTADVMLSQVANAAETQVLAFAAQPADARTPDVAVSGQIANATIASVLGAHSVPDVALSAEDQSVARRLGRSVADRIIAYGKQQGWTVTAVQALPAEEAQAMRNRVADVAAGLAPGFSSNRTRPIPCQAFTKNENGNWYVRGSVSFDLGTAKDVTLENQEIPPKFYTIGGVDLYTAIQQQCRR